MRAQASSVFHEKVIKIAVKATLKHSSSFNFLSGNSKNYSGYRVIYTLSPPTFKNPKIFFFYVV